jgi:hypothetical protein
MPTRKDIPASLLEQLQRDREKIATELPELIERGRLLDEAATENSLSGHLRRAIHRSGRSLKKIAVEIGIDVFVLCDFLEGTRTLRSDVLDRLAQAVRATIQVEPAPPARTPSPTVRRKTRKPQPQRAGTKTRKRNT